MILRPVLLASSVILAGASSPINQVEVFARGVISTHQYESHPAISPDGKLLLFVKSEPDFSRWTIWESRRSSSGWSHPVRAAFAKDDIAADPFFSTDGRHVYFISTRLPPGTTKRNLDIWVVERRGSGWGIPQRLPDPINSPASEWFPRPQKDGTVYFGSDRPGGLGRTDIYRGRRTAMGWQVTNLGEPINSDKDEYELEISPQGTTAVLMADREPNTSGDLYLSCWSNRGWSTPRRLGAPINTAALEVGPLITRDGRYLYFSSRRSDEQLGDIYRTRMPRTAACGRRRSP